MSNTTNKPNTGFWVIGVLALLWNLMGVFAFVGQMNMTPEMMETLPEAEKTLYENTPSWVNIVFGIAVIGGAIGSLLLLFKKKLATVVFGISLLAILAQMFYTFFISDALKVLGNKSVIMPIVVIIIAYFLLAYSKKSSLKGWLS